VNDSLSYEVPLSYKLPSIELSNLISVDKSISIDIVTKLVTIGILEVVNIPNFSTIKRVGLEKVAECLDTNNNNNRITMNDGSYRISMAATSKNNIGTSFDSECGMNSDKLRNTVDMITSLLFRALDIYRDNNKNEELVMKPKYKSFNEIIYNGEHLEHIHAYYGAKNASNINTLNVHTDSGLMIAMTSGFYNNEPKDGTGLYIELPTGILVHAAVADDSLVLMFGDGAQWLNPVLGQQIRPVPHSLVANLDIGNTRSWYGKMILPPYDAWIYDQMTYKEFKQKQISQVQNDMSLPVACSNHRELTSSVCPPGTIHCWMQCMSSSNLTCGASALCWDTYANKEMDGSKMCTPSKACQLQCPIIKNDTIVEEWEGFCYGSGTTMIMEGMKSIIFSKKGDTPCTNLIFEHVTLNNSLKYCFGCLIVLIVCILSQYLTLYRLKLSSEPKYWGRKIVLYFIQMNLGYIIMLVTMTYSVELFLMVTLGLTIGYAIFNVKEGPALVNNGAECCTVEMSDIPQTRYVRVNDLEKETIG